MLSPLRSTLPIPFSHVREKCRNSVRVYMGWHQRWRMRQPALLIMLRSSAQGCRSLQRSTGPFVDHSLCLLSAIKARNCRPISTHVHENCPNLFALNLDAALRFAKDRMCSTCCRCRRHDANNMQSKLCVVSR